MRPLRKTETAVLVVSRETTQQMEHSDGKGGQRGYLLPQQQERHPASSSTSASRRQPQQQQHQHQQYLQQQQQQSWHHHHQQAHQQNNHIYGQSPQQPPPESYSRRGYTQQEIMAAAAAAGQPVLDPSTEYLVQQQQQQQQQQQAQHYLQAAAPPPPTYSSTYPSRQAQYGAPMAYHQQHHHHPTPQDIAIQQSMIGPGAVAQPQIHVLEQQQQHLHPHIQQQQQVSLPPPQQQQQPQQPYMQPRVTRLPSERPIVKLSVSLIDTYKHINTVYYQERDARRAARVKEKAQKPAPSVNVGGGGANNNGWDDENYDYIVTNGELFNGRYKIKERIGKGSFGQVVRAEDIQTQRDVAIKIIKSKKPFLMQAKTEIELLTHLNQKDPDDQHNVVRLLTHFMYRNHQCLVFEMLSLNLYELLKNTQFGGVSLNLIRKFARQVLKALMFLARGDVDIIHCDLKPENILLRHSKKSGVKVIDFGSSCRSNKRMYSYIQSRFYRSPEVMLGLPYNVAIDMWSLGCILAEMHTGEPLFSGSDQFDQMQKIVKLLGMVPNHMLEQASDQHRLQFFERVRTSSGRDEWTIKQQNTSSRIAGSSNNATSPKSQAAPKQVVVPSRDPIASLSDVIRAETHRKKKYPPSETGNSQQNYDLFVDLIYKMLAYDPSLRIRPEDALNHPFITIGETSTTSGAK